MKLNRYIRSIILIAVILGVAYAANTIMILMHEKPAEKPVKKWIPKVSVMEVQPKAFSIFIDSNGKIEPMKRAEISAEVSGKITKVSKQLEVGEILESGAFVAQIDQSDYVTALTNASASIATAEASLADAELVLAQESARAAKNVREWKKLGKGEASELVARMPQLKSAKARILAAESAILQAKEAEKKAMRDLKRTTIYAPYQLKIDKKYAEEGNFIMRGGRVFDGHSDGDLQVRLPITLRDYLLIRDKSAMIELSANMGSETLTWQAQYVRDEGVVDRATLTLPVMAKVLKNPQQQRFSLPPIGLFIDAKILADQKEQVFVIPRNALLLGGRVLVVNGEKTLNIRKVKVVYTSKTDAVIEGVKTGERIVISPLESPVDGMSVEVVSKED